MSQRCGLVTPFWVHRGWVLWAGTATREKLMSIEYQRCPSEVGIPVTIGVHCFPWCAKHAAEMTEPMTKTLSPTDAPA